jgi:hypothetical protein
VSVPHLADDEEEGEEEGEEGEESDAEDDEGAEDSGDGAGAGRSGRGRSRKQGGSRRTEQEIVKINKRTSKASPAQPHETLDGPAELPNMKPMMELEAGKNVWYQAYVLKETINEVKVRFPREFSVCCQGFMRRLC